MAGIGQLLLAIAGFVLVMVWFVLLMLNFVAQINTGGEPHYSGRVGETGAIIFVASWLWSLVTSLSLLNEARANEAAASPPPLPRTNPGAGRL